MRHEYNTSTWEKRREGHARDQGKHWWSYLTWAFSQPLLALQSLVLALLLGLLVFGHVLSAQYVVLARNRDRTLALVLCQVSDVACRRSSPQLQRTSRARI